MRKNERKRYTARQKEKILLSWNGSERQAKVIANNYSVTVRSLYRWKAKYIGTLQSLENKSSRPHSPHPNAHTAEEEFCIRQILEHNPHLSYAEMHGYLRLEKGYTRTFDGFYRFAKRLQIVPVVHYDNYKAQEYQTPAMLGVKVQVDVKFVPRKCHVGQAEKDLKRDNTRFYQFTAIDECSREVFAYCYNECSGHSSKDFAKRLILLFGYRPHMIQTDNGTEFTNPKGTADGKVHIFTQTLEKLGIKHKLIRPYTPRHNGKVERFHRTVQRNFYRFESFDNLPELNDKLKAYLYRYNMYHASSVLKYKAPWEKRTELIEQLKQGSNASRIRFYPTERTEELMYLNKASPPQEAAS